jgi:hypothetical protein
MNFAQQNTTELDEILADTNDVGYTEAELEEMARLDEIRNRYRNTPHEL